MVSKTGKIMDNFIKVKVDQNNCDILSKITTTAKLTMLAYNSQKAWINEYMKIHYWSTGNNCSIFVFYII